MTTTNDPGTSEPLRILRAFNTAFQAHARLPRDADETLARGEPVLVRLGPPDAPTVTLTIARTGNAITGTVDARRDLPARITRDVDERVARFGALVRSGTRPHGTHK